MRTNYVLIDYESVQPPSLGALAQDHYRVIVFVGATQSKLPFELVSALQGMGERAQYVKMSGAGPNALDFHIAFYIGQLAAQDPTAFFHIISKDTGFDPLIRHLKSRHVFAARSASIEEMPLIKVTPKKAAQDRARVFVDLLRQPKSTKPRTDASLRRHLTTYFKKQELGAAEIDAVVNELVTEGHIAIKEGKVTYSLAS